MEVNKMFGKKETLPREGIETILGAGTIFSGNIESTGTIRIDGRVDGDVKAAGDVFVGTTAVIKGAISAANVQLAGTVEGNIKASGLLQILSTAKLFGDISVNSFVADEGAFFQGKCTMMESNTGKNAAASEISGAAGEIAVAAGPGRSKNKYKKSSAIDA
jgi:cytoskeletal protein CcmA (bactofilin family)